jgi:AAA domain
MDLHQGVLANAGPNPSGDPAPIAGERRRGAFEQLRAAIEAGCGPVLVTGEPGAGKTWLAERLAAELPTHWSVASVDLAPAVAGVDFLRLIGHPMGVTAGGGLAEARLLVRGALEDDAADGRQWLLLVDQAERGSPSVWDEVQSIIHHLGRPGGFASLLVSGQTELLRELAGRRGSAFAASVALHIHLLPLDLDEARELLGLDGLAGRAVEPALENLHRDARGNAGRMVRLIQSRPELLRAAWQAPPLAVAASPFQTGTPPSFGLAVLNHPAEDAQVHGSHLSATDRHAAAARSWTPPLFPSRPPIRAEEGLIEVGWDGDLQSELEPAGDNPAPGHAPDPAHHGEPVEDRYAAIQAWNEWTRNQARPPAAMSATGDPLAPEDPETDTALVPDAEVAADPPGAVAASGFRAEGQHEFAPYSQLFTRFRQSNQPGA